MNDSAVRTVTEFRFEDLGVDHAQYFQGVGVACTDWDAVFVGVGDTAREAAGDAWESCCQVAEKCATPELVWEAGKQLSAYNNTISAHVDCEHDGSCLNYAAGAAAKGVQPDPIIGCDCHDECELSHRVALFVKYAD